ncbi:hypothetical protein NMY22_g6901 [Coprinellus aureogranulatus]|nr:hypothetical protein NMY22_g6901 [Coprinellus aureogranulatus]
MFVFHLKWCRQGFSPKSDDEKNRKSPTNLRVGGGEGIKPAVALPACHSAPNDQRPPTHPHPPNHSSWPRSSSFLEMVGWKPCDPLLRREKMGEFIQRVEKSHEFGPKDTPLILQYDDRHADMRPWAWPSEDGVPVRPDALDGHRYTHYFKGPCCPCAFQDDGPSSFHEAKIGLVQMVTQPGTAQCLGQYVALCAQQQCGYFVKLEMFFGHPNLVVAESYRRQKPISVINPFAFLTDDTEETIKRTGLQQVQILGDNNSNALRGTNRLLKREDPSNYILLQDMLKQLVIKGLPADKFWDLSSNARSATLGLPKDIPPPKVIEEWVDVILEQETDADPEYVADLPGPISSSDGFTFASLFPSRPTEVQLPWADPLAEPIRDGLNHLAYSMTAAYRANASGVLRVLGSLRPFKSTLSKTSCRWRTLDERWTAALRSGGQGHGHGLWGASQKMFRCK